MPRPHKPGTIHYLGRVRLHPGTPTDLRNLVEQLEAAGQNETLAILQMLLAGGGYRPEREAVEGEEDSETTAVLEGLLS